jgi:hypothetical protein
MLILVCVQAYRSSRGVAALLAIGGVFGGFPIGFVFPVFFLHAFFNAIMCAVLIPYKPRPRTFGIALVCLMMAVYALKFYRASEKLRELQALKTQFPIESLSNRLSFEQNANGSKMSVATPSQLSATVDANLQRQEKETQESMRFHRRYSRASALEELYENSYPEFVEAAGLGLRFMLPIRFRLNHIDRAEPLTLPAPLGRLGPSTSSEELNDVHWVAVNEFTSPDRMGYARNRDAAAGYEPHSFGSLVARWRAGHDSPKYWQVTRFEFVRVMGDEQRVYLAEVRPTIEIPDVPHWPLNDFEKQVLPQLVMPAGTMVTATATSAPRCSVHR